MMELLAVEDGGLAWIPGVAAVVDNDVDEDRYRHLPCGYWYCTVQRAAGFRSIVRLIISFKPSFCLADDSVVFRRCALSLFHICYTGY